LWKTSWKKRDTFTAQHWNHANVKFVAGQFASTLQSDVLALFLANLSDYSAGGLAGEDDAIPFPAGRERENT